VDGDRPGNRGEIEVITSEIETECLSRDVSFMHGLEPQCPDRVRYNVYGQPVPRNPRVRPSGREARVLWVAHAAGAERG